MFYIEFIQIYMKFAFNSKVKTATLNNNAKLQRTINTHSFTIRKSRIETIELKNDDKYIKIVVNMPTLSKLNNKLHN